MIREIEFNEIKNTLKFIEEVYLKTEYVNDSYEGYKTFLKEFINNDEIILNIKNRNNILYGYYKDSNLVGVISLDDDNYILYLFVDTTYHNLGVASKLLSYVENIVLTRKNHTITLDSSIYGYEFYKKKGFINTSETVVVDSMKYIPMKKEL